MSLHVGVANECNSIPVSQTDKQKKSSGEVYGADISINYRKVSCIFKIHFCIIRSLACITVAQQFLFQIGVCDAFV